jgi:hypothetical protein
MSYEALGRRRAIEVREPVAKSRRIFISEVGRKEMFRSQASSVARVIWAIPVDSLLWLEAARGHDVVNNSEQVRTRKSLLVPCGVPSLADG